MILYTPLSETDIFPYENKSTSNREYVSFEGRTLCVDQTGEGTYQLIQLLSTDPQDFLDNKYSPGTILFKQ